MKKFLILLVSLSLLTIVNAQKKIELSRSTERISNSAYSGFLFLDSRMNPEDMGFVQTTMFNKYTPIIAEKPLGEQFHTLFLSLIDSTAQYKTLLLQLRDLRFKEETKATSERGFCNIRISLYEEKDSAYHFINTIDTIISVKAMDVTEKLLNTTSAIIISELKKNLYILPEDYDMPFSLDDLANIDALEKNNIPIYNTDVLADGLYADFKSFADQTPTYTQLQVKREKGDIKEVKIVNPEKPDKWKKIKPKDYYVVVVEGNPYLTHSNGYFPIIFENGDYFVRTYIPTHNGNTGVQIGLSVGFGMIGGLFGALAASGGTKLMIAKLDHLNGDFIVQP